MHFKSSNPWIILDTLRLLLVRIPIYRYTPTISKTHHLPNYLQRKIAVDLVGKICICLLKFVTLFKLHKKI